VALETLGPDYYAELSAAYRTRRDLLVHALRAAGFRCTPPAGAYYVLADFSDLSDADDVTYARWLALGGSRPGHGQGVAAVPGSSFFHRPDLGRSLIRFAFCKRAETLRDAAVRLRQIARPAAGALHPRGRAPRGGSDSV
jgi:aspartate/methionine/tyrosine aminotransferase